MRTRLTSRLSLLFVSFALVLALPAMAFADELGNVLDNNALDSQYEQMALETGGKTKETLIYVFAVQGDGNSGACNFTDNEPESPTGTDKATVTVSSNATSVATAKWKANNSTSINFTGCGKADGRTLVVTSGSAASETSQTDSILPAEITFDSVNAFGKGTLQMNTARFRVVTSNPANTPPSVSVTGVQAGASYEKGSVPAAGCSVTDTEDTGESATPVFDRSGLDSNGLGPVQVSCSYTDGGGLTETASATYTIQDTGKPSSSHQLSEAANANGWHNQNVTVTLNGSDNQGGSGLKEIRYTTDGGVSYAAYDAANKPVISTEGTTTFSYYAVDNAGNQQAEQSFAVKLDKTAPSVSASVSPDAAASGWYNLGSGAPTVRFECSDSGSGLAAACPAAHTFGEGADQRRSSGDVYDLAGNKASASVSNIDVDLTAPSKPNASLDRAPEDSVGGYFKDTVTVSYSGSTDALSGLKSHSANETFDTTGTHTYSGVAYDNAGNVSQAASGQVKVDASLPEVNPNSVVSQVWRNGPLSEDFTASDTGSGLANAADASFTLTASDESSLTSPTVAQRTVSDRVGHSVTRSVSALIDLTNPLIGASLTTNAAASGWYNLATGAPQVGFQCSDALSGIKSCPANHTIADEGSNLSYSGSAYDNAGNSASAGVSGVKSDQSKPVVNITNAPAASATVNLCTTGGLPAPNYTASDAVSGIASDSGSFTAQPSTATGVGSYTYQAQANDNAGNSNVASRSYNVVYGAGAFGGVQQPINGGATPELTDDNSRFKLGSTVPVKFTLTCNGAPVNNAVAKLNVKKADGTPDPGIDEAVSTAASTTGNLFRYDAMSGQYIFNLSTKTGYTNPNGTTVSFAAGTYTLSVMLDDGTFRSVNINIVR